MGDREATLRLAVEDLKGRADLSVEKVSSFIETEPVGGPPQNAFLNAAAELRTDLEPHGLLTALQQTEDNFGRARMVRWGPRSLDLDLLLYGDQVVQTPQLTVPHPLMHERRFVLEPLCEIAPDAVHPVLRKTIRQLLDEVLQPKRDLP